MPGPRLAAYFGAVFFYIGIHLPFWPVWLAARGLSPAQIGAVLSAPMLVRLVADPLVGALSDRLGSRRRVLMVAASASLVATALYGVTPGFPGLLAVGALAGLCLAALVPVADALAAGLAVAGRIDYGRVRLWGSLTFILAATAGGSVLQARSADAILPALLGALALVAVAAAALPGEAPARRASPDREPGSAEPPPRLALLRRPAFLLFLAGAGLAQASHAVLYGFGTLHWRAAGIDGTTIGWLWAEGVVAEIVLFWLGGRALARLGPLGLVALGAGAGVVRWTALALTTDLAVLLLVQPLHALTFGAVHLGAVHHIARTVPPLGAARAQGLYSAVSSGIAMSLGLLAAGPLYAAAGGGAFLAMTGLCLVALAALLALARRMRALPPQATLR